MEYDYEGAIKAGANPDDVLKYLSNKHKYDYEGAISAGANRDDVIKYLATKQEVSSVAEQPNFIQCGQVANLFQAFDIFNIKIVFGLASFFDAVFLF